MNANQDSTQQAALRAARRGWAVLPLHWAEDGKCSCGRPDCSSPAKHPLTAHGVKDATTYETAIRKCWTKWPKANVGISTGAKSRVVVLDVDNRHGGPSSLLKLENEYGALPDGPVVLTGGGSGSKHLYLVCPKGGLGNKTGVRPGIDLRGDGGYVVGAGSVHVSGKRYEWEYGKTPSKLSLPQCPDWLLALVTGNKPVHESRIPRGERNSQLTSLAGTMLRRGFSLQAVEAALIEENQFHCEPPLDDREVKTIVSSVSRYQAEVIPASLEAGTERKPLPFRTAADFSIATPLNVPWLSKPWVAKGCITEVTGKIKNGKTTFLMALVAAVTSGNQFLGQPTQTTGVVYLSEERDVTFSETLRRAGLRQSENFTLLLASETRGWSWPALVQSAADECTRRSAVLLVIDTFAQFSALEHAQENSAGDVLAAVKPLQQAAASGLAVIIVHHERKGGGDVSDSGRGSSALAGAVDIVASIRKPEGNPKRNVRRLQTVSRFSETPPELLIELSDDGYRTLGTPSEIATEQSTTSLLTVIPNNKKQAAAIEDLIESTRRGRAYVQRHLDSLLDQGKIQRTGKGVRGDSYRYFVP